MKSQRVPGAMPRLVGFGELGLGGTLGDIDPLNMVPFKRATSRVQKGPL